MKNFTLQIKYFIIYMQIKKLNCIEKKVQWTFDLILN